ncbi:MAG: RNA polymerase sigma factor [Deltaproteobacteria bacterium]|nr:RNA polymerase sigma factor [Deltaproteobacteria bacterium]
MSEGKLIPLRRVAGRPDELSDEALLAGCASGERAALGALFDRHHAAVYRFLARVSGAVERDLDDLVQATFLEVPGAAGRYRGTARVPTWLLAVAANVARHHARAEGRRRKAHARLAEVPPGGSPRPDEAVERRQLVLRVGAALADLSYDLRVVFVMCDVEEVPGVEAARVLGVREGTLWRRLHDARRALRAALEGDRR